MPFIADMVAGMWTGSMRQATHGTEIQPVSTEIKAAEFCIERKKIRDITASLQRSMKRDDALAKENPGGRLLAQMFCGPSIYVGMQAAWESHEFKRMRPKGNELPAKLKTPAEVAGSRSRSRRNRTRRKGKKE